MIRSDFRHDDTVAGAYRGPPCWDPLYGDIGPLTSHESSGVLLVYLYGVYQSNKTAKIRTPLDNNVEATLIQAAVVDQLRKD